MCTISPLTSFSTTLSSFSLSGILSSSSPLVTECIKSSTFLEISPMTSVASSESSLCALLRALKIALGIFPWLGHRLAGRSVRERRFCSSRSRPLLKCEDCSTEHRIMWYHHVNSSLITLNLSVRVIWMDRYIRLQVCVFTVYWVVLCFSNASENLFYILNIDELVDWQSQQRSPIYGGSLLVP